MALTDPQSITVNAIAKSMPRILSEGAHSLYRKSDLTFSLDIRHRNVTRNRKKYVVSTVQFAQRKIVSDPLTSEQDYEVAFWSVQLDKPEVGYTDTELSDMWTGFKTWYDTTMVGRIIGQEA